MASVSNYRSLLLPTPQWRYGHFLANALLLAWTSWALAQDHELTPQALSTEKSATSSAQLAPSQPHIEIWLDDLASNSYATRMAAMEGLISAGPPAIDAIMRQLAHTDDAEIQLRSLEVLERLANREIASRKSPAIKALENLNQSERPILASRAGSRLKRVSDRRRHYALARLAQLGANVDAEWPIRQVGGRMMISEVVELKSDTWHGNGEDAQLIADLTGVSSVRFGGPKITDEYMVPVGQLDHLTTLQLNRTAVTDEGIAQLVGCTHLGRLEIRYAEITDAAIDSLLKLPLHFIEITGTRMTSAAADALRDRMTGATVEFRAGAYLGVGADSFGDGSTKGCRLTKVQENSAAQRAGMLEGDVIVQYNGRDVNGFEALRKLIGENRAGDVVTVEWLRNDKTFKAQVELGAWD